MSQFLSIPSQPKERGVLRNSSLPESFPLVPGQKVESSLGIGRLRFQGAALLGKEEGFPFHPARAVQSPEPPTLYGPKIRPFGSLSKFCYTRFSILGQGGVSPSQGISLDKIFGVFRGTTESLGESPGFSLSGKGPLGWLSRIGRHTKREPFSGSFRLKRSRPLPWACSFGFSTGFVTAESFSGTEPWHRFR